MDWQEQLITVYLYARKHYARNLWVYCQRMSIYANRHLRCWFSRLPSYVAYVQRLNRLSDVFAPLLEINQKEQEKSRVKDMQSLLLDLFPVALAK